MSNISDRLNKVLDTLNSNKLAQVAFQEFYRLTPVNKNPKAKNRGNAKRSTTLNGNKIQANYAYANVLDQGRGFRDGQMRGSDQAPNGMTQPSLEALRKYVYEQSGIKLK